MGGGGPDLDDENLGFVLGPPLISCESQRLGGVGLVLPRKDLGTHLQGFSWKGWEAPVAFGFKIAHAAL